MSVTAKVSISVPDEDLLRWAKERSEKKGVSLSAVFTEAVRIERQMEARRSFLDEIGADAKPTPGEAAAIRAEWETEAEKPARVRKRTVDTAKAAARKKGKRTAGKTAAKA
ncbi:MAG: hypothetical protein JWP87_3692 [Labilithrix sp.]|nr:hypothetical protein [Labilithrix sp.]